MEENNDNFIRQKVANRELRKATSDEFTKFIEERRVFFGKIATHFKDRSLSVTIHFGRNEAYVKFVGKDENNQRKCYHIILSNQSTLAGPNLKLGDEIFKISTSSSFSRLPSSE
jgi:hypothetical protein